MSCPNHRLSRLFASLVFTLAACSQTPANIPGGSGAVGGAEPYVMKGYVTDSRGAPLEGIEDFADNTLL